jgi:hypothetical protein
VALVWPAELTVIEPAQPHEHCDESSRAATPPMVTDEDPGLHGPTTRGTHGCGVSTPIAADVAEATAGLEREVHIPKGGMLAAVVSVTTPTGEPVVTSVPVAANEEGVVPIEHAISAPVQTMSAISGKRLWRPELSSMGMGPLRGRRPQGPCTARNTAGLRRGFLPPGTP